jgi:hypothetical protein
LDLHNGQTRFELALDQPLTWAGWAGELLILGTPESALGVLPENGSIVWSTHPGKGATGEATPGGARSPALTFRLAGDHVHYMLEGVETGALNAGDGTSRWSFRPQSGSLGRFWQASERMVAVEIAPPGLIAVLDASDGRVAAVSAQDASPWNRDPALFSEGRYLVVSADGQPAAILDAQSGARVSADAGPVSFALESPRFLAHGQALVTLIDGTTLARVDPLTGHRLWSVRVEYDPAWRAHDSASLDEERVYMVTAGILTAFRLTDGKLVWEQYLGPPDENWKLARLGRSLALFPARPSGSLPVVLCDSTSGRFTSRVHVGGAADRASVVTTGDVAVVATQTTIVALANPSLHSE